MSLIRWPYGRALKPQSNPKPTLSRRADNPISGNQRQQRKDYPRRALMYASLLGSEAPVAVISQHPEKLGQMIGWLCDQSLPVLVAKSLSNVARTEFGSRCPFAMLVVDVDSLGDLEDVTDDLVRLRRDNSEMLVILISAGFGRDDFSLARLPVADVSLRWPVNFLRLEIAVCEAQVNNIAWQSRLELIA